MKKLPIILACIFLLTGCLEYFETKEKIKEKYDVRAWFECAGDACTDLKGDNKSLHFVFMAMVDAYNGTIEQCQIRTLSVDEVGKTKEQLIGWGEHSWLCDLSSEVWRLRDENKKLKKLIEGYEGRDF